NDLSRHPPRRVRRKATAHPGLAERIDRESVVERTLDRRTVRGRKPFHLREIPNRTAKPRERAGRIVDAPFRHSKREDVDVDAARLELQNLLKQESVRSARELVDD